MGENFKYIKSTDFDLSFLGEQMLPSFDFDGENDGQYEEAEYISKYLSGRMYGSRPENEKRIIVHDEADDGESELSWGCIATIRCADRTIRIGYYHCGGWDLCEEFEDNTDSLSVWRESIEEANYGKSFGLSDIC